MIKNRIGELLKERGVSEKELMEHMGISRKTFDKLVQNESESIKYEHIESICRFLNVTPNDVLEWDFKK